MSAAKKIDAYVDAVKELRALHLAIKLEGVTDERARLVKLAGVRVTERMRVLTGGQIGHARRILAQEVTP